MKNVAIQSLKHKIKLDFRSNVSLDHIYLEKYLKYVKGYNPYFVSPKNKGDKNLPENYLDASDTDITQFDEMFVFASTANFVAGVVHPFTTNTLTNMLKFKGPINVVIIDLIMPMYNYFEVFKNRKYLNFLDKSFSYTDEDIEAFSKLNFQVWYCGLDYSKFLARFRAKKYKYYLDIPNQVEFYPASPFTFANKNIERHNFEKSFDLVYYGIPKTDYRQRKVAKYFDNPDMKKRIIGYERAFENTECEKSMKLDRLYLEVQRAKASIVLCDDYPDNFVSHRFFENIKCGILNFIDIDYDIDKKFYQDEWLKEHMYVENSGDILRVLDLVKRHPEAYDIIIKKQDREMQRHCNGFIIKEIIEDTQLNGIQF